MARASEAMRQLYGPHADEVYVQLESVDPELNELIQRVAYDGFWLRPGLGMRDKSIATVSAIVALNLPTPLRLHMIGFLSAGGTRDELRNILLHLVPYVGFPAVLTAWSVFQEVMAELDTPTEGAR